MGMDVNKLFEENASAWNKSRSKFSLWLKSEDVSKLIIYSTHGVLTLHSEKV